MALTDKLTAIANAIREKTGSTEPMTLDEMAETILTLGNGEGGSSGETTMSFNSATGVLTINEV